MLRFMKAWKSVLADSRSKKSLVQCVLEGDAVEGKVIDEEGHTAFTLRLANGLRIHSMSSNCDAQAGKRSGPGNRPRH